jgi:S-layer homology domain
MSQSPKQSPYTDVSMKDPDASYILLATQYGLASGQDGKFHPDNTISRAEAAKILVRGSNIEISKKIRTFNDIAVYGELKQYIQTAYDNCILHGRHTLNGVSTLPG